MPNGYITIDISFLVLNIRGEHLTCADLENFVRGVPALTLFCGCFFKLMREGRILIPL